MQYDAYMKEKNGKYRYFITKQTELSDFYIKKNQRQEQNNILEILENMPDSFNDELYKKFDINNWKYYIAKYPGNSTHQGTRYGIGVWDNYDDYPLDLVLLNSSQHSENNIEWMMMTYLLMNELNDDNKYRLDNHACSPITITKNASTIQFKNGKWIVSGQSLDSETIKTNLSDFGLDILEEDGKLRIGLSQNNKDKDYIDLGKTLVKLLEE
jgi:hypothetical protein